MRSCVRSSRALSPALFPRLLSDAGCWGTQPAYRGLWSAPRNLSSGGDANQQAPLPSQARVVICGGGIVGTSVAYHLAKLGWTEIVLLEQGRYRTNHVSTCFLLNFHNTFYLLVSAAVSNYKVCFPSPCDRLGAGTTRMCAGIVSVAKPIFIESKMADYSSTLYEHLEEETGVKTGGVSTLPFYIQNLFLSQNSLLH